MNHSFDIEIACKVGVNEAIILQHIGFWHQKNVGNDKNYYDGRYWSRMSISGFHETFSYLTAKEIAGALLRLQKGGFISTANYNKIGYDKTLWYGLTELGHSLLQLKCHFTKSKMDSTKGQIEDTKKSNRKVQKVEPIPYVKEDIATDIDLTPPQKTINYLDRPNPKTDTELTEKLVMYLEDKNDISQEARRSVIEQMSRTCRKLSGRGFTLPQALREAIMWFSMKYVSKNKPLNITYSAFISALKCELYYYDSQQPEIKTEPVRQKTTSIEERMKADGYA